MILGLEEEQEEQTTKEVCEVGKVLNGDPEVVDPRALNESWHDTVGHEDQGLGGLNLLRKRKFKGRLKYKKGGLYRTE